jgi:hypothetical protein
MALRACSRLGLRETRTHRDAPLGCRLDRQGVGRFNRGNVNTFIIAGKIATAESRDRLLHALPDLRFVCYIA